jgi:hypothetical protein
VRLGLLKPDTPARFSLGSLIYLTFALAFAFADAEAFA